MKRTTLVLAVALAATAPVAADVHITEAVREESTFLGFTTRTEEKPAQELWIGGNRAALTQQGYSIIIDLDRSWLCFVNHREETYVEMTLPLEISTVFSEELRARRPAEKMTGSVTDTGATRRILDRDCREYQVTMWEVSDRERSSQRTLAVWATTDVDFEWGVVDELLSNTRIIFNRDERLRKELRKIAGVQMGLEYEGGKLLAGKRVISEVNEISEEEPPAGTYEPPAGYEKKVRLTAADF